MRKRVAVKPLSFFILSEATEWGDAAQLVLCFYMYKQLLIHVQAIACTCKSKEHGVGDDKERSGSGGLPLAWMPKLIVPPFFTGMSLFPPLHCIHALNAMNASLSHGFAAADMGASETASRLQKHLDAQKQDR